MRIALNGLASLLSATLLAQEPVVRLYNGPAPGSENWTQEEKENNHNSWQTRVVYNVAQPTLTVFLPDPSIATGTAVVICPGGGFFALSIDSEGFEVARWLTAKGVACFVLKYRLLECKTDDPTTELAARWNNLGEIVAPPNCTCWPGAVTGLGCASRTCLRIAGSSASPTGWTGRDC
jgi:hypothetical protein